MSKIIQRLCGAAWNEPGIWLQGLLLMYMGVKGRKL